MKDSSLHSIAIASNKNAAELVGRDGSLQKKNSYYLPFILTSFINEMQMFIIKNTLILTLQKALL